MQRGFKLTVVASAALMLFASSVGGTQLIRIRRENAARLAAEEQVRAQMQAEATEKFAALLREATNALNAADISKATELLEEALAINHVKNNEEAWQLAQKVEHSDNSAWILLKLVHASEDEFARFQRDGVPLKSLDFGFAVLNDRALRQAKEQMEAAIAKRAENKRMAAAAAEQRRMAQEAQRKAEEEQIIAQRAADEQQAAQEQAAQAEAQRTVRQRLEAFMSVLEAAEVTLIKSVSVRRIGERTWEATLTVHDIWHLRHYQLRLQDAQTLWKAWAAVASPSDPDLARIKLVDGNGNDVGGSRMLAGSLIWVQEQ